MPNPRLDEPSIFNLQSILFAIFKHKKLVLISTILGLVAAAAVYILFPASYNSEAKLFVRYVVDRSAVDTIDRSVSAANSKGNTVIGSEMTILSSWDLAMQVAQTLGPKRILPDSAKPTLEEAAGTITSGLTLSSGKDSNIITVDYQNRHPEVAIAVLNELVNRYFVKHLEVHRSAGAFDFVSQQTDQVRAKLNQTEDALKALKSKTGILSVSDSVTGFNTESGRLDEQLREAESEYAEQEARLKQLGAGSGLAGDKTEGNGASPAPSATPSSKDIDQYQAIASRLEHARQAALEMSAKYTSENVLVKMNQAAIDDLESQKKTLEKKYPELSAKGGGQTGNRLDPSSERARLAGIKAKVEDLRNRRNGLQDKLKQLADLAPQIASLERERDLQEANYKYFQGTLEKARVDEALDPTKMPNISAVQRPSPPSRVTKTRDRAAIVLAGGGLGLGLLISLFLELLVHRSFKRRGEIESTLHAPVMLSIPEERGRAGRKKLPWKNGSGRKNGSNGDGQVSPAPWDPGHFIRPYSEAIRDRLGLYFELNGITHKPKLVGVTGFGEGAGVSTLAAGVAAALSETGDGKVLLVDVNASNGDAHPFFAGRPAASLTKAIEPAAPITSAAENLYLATVGQTDKRAQLGLKKFFSLVPNLKASDFDYIIFDLPPLSQTSPTIGLSALMDKVLLVIPSEKNQRESVKRGFQELTAARADVSIVLNKTRSYAPKWIDSTN